MIVVSDTSPITNLIAIGHIKLIHDIYGEIVIPPGVKTELYAWKEKQSDILDFLSQPKTSIIIPTDHALVSKLLSKLDQGESEAISLAIQLKADRLMIDERNGRSEAISLSIEVVGVVGLLIQARKRNLIPSLRNVLHELQDIAKFRISGALLKFALKEVNEI